jgi:hypothetical protein
MPKAALWDVVKYICKEHLSTQPQFLMNITTISINASSELHFKLHLIAIIPVMYRSQGPWFEKAVSNALVGWFRIVLWEKCD